MRHTTKNVLVFACFLAVSSFAFAQHPIIKTVPAKWTPPNSGHAMYQEYCAVCHGTNARGNGPLAKSLKDSPTDLTKLASQNGGKFPSLHVSTVLRCGTDTPAHGTASMPVWGPVFRSVSKANDLEIEQRTANLSRYLQTLQEK